MKKKILLLLFMLMSFASAVFAQVPTVMMYQVQVNHGESQPKDVSIEMQLRKSQNGVAIWSQVFDFAEMKNYTTVNLALDMGNKFDWNDGEYWLATVINGKEMGCARLTSVPYAFMAKHAETAEKAVESLTAETLSTNITREELIGYWVGADSLSDEDGSSDEDIYFYEDGSLKYYVYGKLYYTGTWKLIGNLLRTKMIDAESGRVEAGVSLLGYDKEEEMLYQSEMGSEQAIYHTRSIKKVK